MNQFENESTDIAGYTGFVYTPMGKGIRSKPMERGRREDRFTPVRVGVLQPRLEQGEHCSDDAVFLRTIIRIFMAAGNSDRSEGGG